MRFSPEQEKRLRRMCMEQRPNAEIAEALKVDVSKVHAWRSKKHLTRKDVAELLASGYVAATPTTDTAKGRRVIDVLRELDTHDMAAWLEGFRLDSSDVCKFCESPVKNCTEGPDQRCVAALTKYLESEASEV